VIRGEIFVAHAFIQKPLTSAKLTGDLGFVPFPTLDPPLTLCMGWTRYRGPRAQMKQLSKEWSFRRLLLLLAACGKHNISWSFKASLPPKAKSWPWVNYS